MGKKMNERKTSFMKLIQFLLYWFDGQFAGGYYVIYKLICSIICVHVQFILSSSNCCEFCRHCTCLLSCIDWRCFDRIHTYIVKPVNEICFTSLHITRYGTWRNLFRIRRLAYHITTKSREKSKIPSPKTIWNVTVTFQFVFSFYSSIQLG